MVFEVNEPRHGQPKGAKQVLVVRELWREGMHKDEALRVLADCDDFRTQPTLLQELAARRGHLVYLPKFHCELNPMELLWAAAKWHARSHCNYSFAALRQAVLAALGSVSAAHIRRCFMHCAS